MDIPKPKLNFNTSLPSAGNFNLGIPAGPGLAGMGAGASSLVNSSKNSPAAKLEGDDRLKLDNYKYPSDLGTNYRHIMRIFIFQQQKSKYNYSTVPGNQFRFDQQAGQDKNYNVSATGAAVTLAGVNTVSSATDGILNKTAKTAVSGGAAVAVSDNLDISRKTKKACAYISLYMPDAITFDDKHDFDPVSVTEALGNAGVLQAAAGAVTGSNPGAPGATEGAAKLAEGSDIVGRGILDVNLFSQGYALNPQLEIMYKGSKQRQFTFQFRFAPRNQPEMEELESIIRTLRFHAAPEYSKGTSSRYFVPPSEFEVDFYIGEENNRHIPRIAQSVLTNVDVNYAPQGHYTAFYDGAPTEVQMQLTFLETVVLTKDDIMIGY